MKKVMDTIMDTILINFAYRVSELSANSRCVYIFHQPEKPDSLKKLRKF